MLTKKYRRNKFSRRKVILGVILVVAGSMLATIAFLSLFTNKLSAPAKDEVASEPKPQQISSNVLFLGNTFWGRYINDWSMASDLQYAYPFSRLSEFDRDKYDAWISGLECPTASGVNMTSAEMEATLTFNCSPEYLPEAAKWFTAFTLASNHTDNQGAEGFAETREQLDKYGIQYFGHYDPRVSDDICEIISLQVTVKLDDETTQKGKLPVAMCGFHGVFMIPPAEGVEEMAKYSAVMPVFALPHMGAEYQSAPDQIKTDFYHSLIDGGADVVLGDHPHWIQTTESYEGHLIVYSMGNFMFDQQDTADVVRSAGINVVLQTTSVDKDQLSKWLEIGETCASFKDDCLSQIKQENLTKLDITYQFGVVGTNDAEKITKPATAEQQESILERLNWQTTMSQLQSPYSSL